MKIHILGICGTFMGGIAMLARGMGHTVTGSDANVYPPMSTQLENYGIELIEGYDSKQLRPAPDVTLIGNALSRGNVCVEYILNNGLHYQSGPAWLHNFLLPGKHVLAVAGTHGKTTTASMLAWILEENGRDPGFLIGGVPENFGMSARLSEDDYFVVEADEYDTAFFDKRSKFVHYQPQTLVINNIEYDHADIFADIAAIRREFHHLVRIIPEQGLIVANQNDEQIRNVISMGCWTPVEYFGSDESHWLARPLQSDCSNFAVSNSNVPAGTVQWGLMGVHNMNNALAAIAAANHVGIAPQNACAALGTFKSVKRRMELLAELNGIKIYDDFAHHPTAILHTLSGLRKHVGKERIIAVMEPRSNTMLRGVHKDTLGPSFEDADQVIFYEPPGMQWNLESATRGISAKRNIYKKTGEIIDHITGIIQPHDHILIMSNGSFENLHQRLIDRISNYAE